MNKKFIESTYLMGTQIFAINSFETNPHSPFHDKNIVQLVKEIKEWLATKQVVYSLPWFYFENEEDRVEWLFRFGDYIFVKTLQESRYPYSVYKFSSLAGCQNDI